MDFQKTNKELNAFQNEWFDKIFKPYVEQHFDKGITEPFCVGVCNKYASADKRVMIVGQETYGWKPFDKNVNLSDLQQWAIDYQNRQYKYEKNEYKFNTSPFWNFFRSFCEKGIVPCWNNIDKAQRNINNKSKSLTLEIEMVLNEKLPNTSKTLFQKEIEITKPNRMIFITGPKYYRTMEKALCLNENSLKPFIPSPSAFCTDITEIVDIGIPVFWTYHPKYLQLAKKFDDVIKNICL